MNNLRNPAASTTSVSPNRRSFQNSFFLSQQNLPTVSREDAYWVLATSEPLQTILRVNSARNGMTLAV